MNADEVAADQTGSASRRAGEPINVGSLLASMRYLGTDNPLKRRAEQVSLEFARWIVDHADNMDDGYPLPILEVGVSYMAVTLDGGLRRGRPDARLPDPGVAESRSAATPATPASPRPGAVASRSAARRGHVRLALAAFAEVVSAALARWWKAVEDFVQAAAIALLEFASRKVAHDGEQRDSLDDSHDESVDWLLPRDVRV